MIVMSGDGLMSYYESIFYLCQLHGWTKTEIDELFPWEYDVMKALLSNYLETKALANQNG